MHAHILAWHPKLILGEKLESRAPKTINGITKSFSFGASAQEACVIQGVRPMRVFRLLLCF